MNKAMIFVVAPISATLFFLGLVIVVWSVRQIRMGITAQSWPQTTGQLLRVSGGDALKGRTPRMIQVQYAYSVNGTNHTGSVIHPTYRSPNSHPESAKLHELLSSAASVRVYYDPNTPRRSTLSVGYYSGALMLPICGALFCLMGIVCLIVGWVATTSDTDFARGVTVISRGQGA
jgi:hypothetical protein